MRGKHRWLRGSSASSSSSSNWFWRFDCQLRFLPLTSPSSELPFGSVRLADGPIIAVICECVVTHKHRTKKKKLKTRGHRIDPRGQGRAPRGNTICWWFVVCLFALPRVSDRAFSAFSSPSSWSSLFRKVFNGDADDRCYQRREVSLSKAFFFFDRSSRTHVRARLTGVYLQWDDGFFSGVSGGLLPVVDVGFFFRSSHSATQVWTWSRFCDAFWWLATCSAVCLVEKG